MEPANGKSIVCPARPGESAHLGPSRLLRVSCSYHCGSVDHFLELFHGQAPDSLAGRLCFEYARLLRERVDTLSSGCRGLALKFQVETAPDFKRSMLLEFAGCYCEQALDCSLDVLSLQTSSLSDGSISTRNGQSARRLCFGLHGFHGFHGFHGLHGLHRRHGLHWQDHFVKSARKPVQSDEYRARSTPPC